MANTLAYSVYINYTSVNSASSPWNNTNTLPQPGYIWNNFLDETGTPSSIGMEETGTFDGVYGAGVNTGNNSGIFPDKVMIDSYGLFSGDSATLKITGLNLTMKYNFTFFASSIAGGDVNVAYSLNGKRCILNASLNTTGTVTAYDIVPDINGEVIITIAPGTPVSQFGLIGALIIQGFNASSNTIPQPPPMHAFAKNTAEEKKNSSNANAVVTDKISDVVSVYPNPFHQNITLSLFAKANENIEVMMFDVNGKLVYTQQFNNVNEGKNHLNIRANENFLTPGVYVMKVIYINRNTFKIIKLIKQ